MVNAWIGRYCKSLDISGRRRQQRESLVIWRPYLLSHSTLSRLNTQGHTCLHLLLILPPPFSGREILNFCTACYLWHSLMFFWSVTLRLREQRAMSSLIIHLFCLLSYTRKLFLPFPHAYTHTHTRTHPWTSPSTHCSIHIIKAICHTLKLFNV